MEHLKSKKLFENAYQAKTDNNYWNQIFRLRKFVNQKMISDCFELIDSDDLKYKRIGIDILSQLSVDRKSFMPKLFEKIFKIFEDSTNEKLIYTGLLAIGHNNKFVKIKHLSILKKFKHSKSIAVRNALTFSLLGIEKKDAIDH